MVSTSTEIQSDLANAKLKGLARKLIRNNLLDEKTALQATEEAEKSRVQLVTHLVDTKLVSAMDIARMASQEFNLPLFDLTALDLDAATVKLVKEDLIRKHRALPLYKRGGRLFIGISDPTNQRALEEIKFQTNLNAEPVVLVEDQLGPFIEKALANPMDEMDEFEDMGDIDIQLGQEEEKAPELPADGGANEAPIVRFVNQMLLRAINIGASDVHFEPYENIYRVRFRQDGILTEVAKPPIAMSPRIAARIKVMAQLDIAERRVPQDGRIKMHLSKKRAIDFRVNTLPTLFGEKAVLRILDPTQAKLGIEVLGYEDNQKKLFLDAIHKPQGMVLVTGPTGSGKTVSLYTALNILNTPEVNISTAEDPVEINFAGINQVNVNLKTGMTFANALRAFLRQDPDIIMVGEVRDLETAEIAIKAAQTGHMVLSTLHTNSAPQTLTRLMNMGVAPYNIASSVSLIIAQRLARRLHSCKDEDHVPPEELINQGFREDELENLTIFRAVGCDQCNKGYKGRVGIYEVMPVTEDIGRIIMAGGNAIEIADQAKREGVNNLRQSGLNKVRLGLTSLEEINRVTKD